MLIENLMILLGLFSFICLVFAIAELFALGGIKLAMRVMTWYDDITTWRYVRKSRRFWKRVKRGEI